MRKVYAGVWITRKARFWSCVKFTRLRGLHTGPDFGHAQSLRGCVDCTQARFQVMRRVYAVAQIAHRARFWSCVEFTRLRKLHTELDFGDA